MRSKSTLSLFMVESGRAGTACACPSCLLCYLNVARNRGVLSLIVFCWALPRLKIGCLCRTENGLASRAKRYPLCCLPTCEPCWLHTWQARSFGAKRHQAETLTSPRLLLDGAFPIPPATQISSVAARCAIAIFPRAAARWSAGSVHPAPADRRRSPCGSAAPASAPAPGGTRRRPPFSLPAALQILRSGS